MNRFVITSSGFTENNYVSCDEASVDALCEAISFATADYAKTFINRICKNGGSSDEFTIIQLTDEQQALVIHAN